MPTEVIVAIMLLSLVAGAGAGWIACTVAQVLPMQEKIMQMRIMGFDPVRRPPPPPEEDSFPEVNET